MLAAGTYDAVFSIMKFKYNATAQTELLAVPGNSQLLASATELARPRHEVLRRQISSNTASRYAAFVMFGAKGSNTSSYSLSTPAKCHKPAAAPPPQTPSPCTAQGRCPQCSAEKQPVSFPRAARSPWIAGENARMPCSARAQGVAPHHERGCGRSTIATSAAE